MKRALTGIAAAAVVLGTAAPMAFAATSSGLTKAGQLPIVVNGSVLSNPYEMTGKDSGNTTAYFPVYYFNQALSKIGFTASWDGVTHTWAITAPGVDASTVASSIAGGVGTGNTTITVNGTVVKKINTKAAKDPAASKSAAATTYFPAYYIDEIFNSLGANVSFSGQTGLKITGSATNGSGATLSALSLTNQSIGTGTAASPAVSYGNAVSATATLTDSNGNPIAGVDATLTLVGSSQAPTVTVNGVTVNNTSTTPGTFTYAVSTNAGGQAVASINVPTGVDASYTVQYSAPYTVNGTNVTDKDQYVEFVTGSGFAISPASSSTYQAPVSDASSNSGLVPVTVTLPELNGSPQVNVPVTFELSATGTNTGAFFANSAGSALTGQVSSTTSQKATAYTNSEGQAVVYVNSDETGTFTVTATQGGNQQHVDIQYGNAGTVYQLNSTISASGVNGGTGTSATPWTASNSSNVVISGTAEDVLGNPVPNAQLLINSVGGQGSYVSGSTTTGFENAVPSVGADVTSTGAPFGELVTTNASGQFSFTVTDSSDNNQYNIYGVNNGEVSTDSIGSAYVNFAGNTNSVTNIGVATYNGLVSSWKGNSSAPVTSLSSVEFAGTTENGSGQIKGTPSYLEFGAFDGQNYDYLADNSSATLSYQVSVDKSAFIDAIDGVLLDGTNTGLPNKASAVSVGISPEATPSSATSGTVWYSVSVNGIKIGEFDTAGDSNPVDLTSGVSDDFALPKDVATALATGHNLIDAINVGVGDKTSETPTVTVSDGSVSATATPEFVSGGASQIAANSSQITAPNGTGANVTLTVEDANGNPVPYAPVSVTSTGNSNMWITAVNGAQLTQNIGGASGTATEQTPVPLYDVSDLGYSSVVVPGVISYTTNGVVLYTDDSGKVTLTLNNDAVPYYQGGSSYAVTTSSSTPQTTAVVSYNSDTFGGVDISAVAPTTSGQTTESTINWN